MTGIPSPESEPTSYVAGAVRQAGPRARYFRFQPALPTSCSIDETSIEKLVELQAVGRAHVEPGGPAAPTRWPRSSSC